MMNLWTRGRNIPINACAMLMLNLVSPVAQAAENEVIQVQFETSCSDAVRSEFNEAITLLHSFEYPETTRRFNQIIEKDPACAMARWGAAMSVWHPLWAPPSKADLEKGAKILADTDSLDATPRETAYINAAKAFFSSNDIKTHRQRAGMFEARMAELYADNLDDPEAAVFYALALLASADPRDKSYAHQFKSAGLLNWVRDIYPTHPGVLHYLIHSYDYPGLAHLALESAKYMRMRRLIRLMRSTCHRTYLRVSVYGTVHLRQTMTRPDPLRSTQCRRIYRDTMMKVCTAWTT